MTALERICGALRGAGVRYAVVGGHAVALHGAVRGTIDVDLVLRWNLRSLEQAEAALNGIGLESRLPISAAEVFAFRDEYIANRNLIAWNFHNPDDPLDQVDIVINYDLTGKRTRRFELASGTGGGVVAGRSDRDEARERATPGSRGRAGVGAVGEAMKRDPPPRPVQYFSDDYLERCRALSPDDIVRFLDDFKRIQAEPGSTSRLISLKVPDPLLATFKTKARLEGVPYQTQIKNLMRRWLEEPDPPGDGPR